MAINQKQYLTFRLVLLGLILLTLAVSSLTILAIATFLPEDYIFSLIVVVIAMLFAVFELIMTIKNIKKPLSIYKIGFTYRGLLNPIPLIAVAMGAVIGLSLSLLGIILFFIREEAVIKCNSLVVLSIGFYLLVNCIFYIIFILFARKRVN